MAPKGTYHALHRRARACIRRHRRPRDHRSRKVGLLHKGDPFSFERIWITLRTAVSRRQPYAVPALRRIALREADLLFHSGNISREGRLRYLHRWRGESRGPISLDESTRANFLSYVLPPIRTSESGRTITAIVAIARTRRLRASFNGADCTELLLEVWRLIGCRHPTNES